MAEVVQGMQGRDTKQQYKELSRGQVEEFGGGGSSGDAWEDYSDTVTQIVVGSG